MVQEARLERTEYGLAPATEGWFAVNVRDAAWMTDEVFGDACMIEGDAVAFPQVGYTLAVLQPGQPNGMYHREDDQEDFLVLSGECLLLVEGEERRVAGVGLRALPGRHRAHLRRRGRGTVRDLHGRRRAPTAAARSTRATRPRCATAPGSRPTRRVARGLRAVPEVEAGAAGELARPALGRVMIRVA